jgi:hypothetical protein
MTKTTNNNKIQLTFRASIHPSLHCPSSPCLHPHNENSKCLVPAETKKDNKNEKRKKEEEWILTITKEGKDEGLAGHLPAAACIGCQLSAASSCLIPHIHILLFAFFFCLLLLHSLGYCYCYCCCFFA